MSRVGDDRECGGVPGHRVSAPPELARRFALLAECSNDILLATTASGEIVAANDRAVEAYGFTPETLTRMRVAELRAEETLQLLPLQLQAAQERGTVFETRHRRRDGSTFPVEVSSRSVKIDGGTFLVSVVRDIGARRRAEEAARLSEEKFRTAFHHAGFGIVLVGPGGGIADHNGAFAQMLGYPSTELHGARLADLVHPSDRARSARRIGELLSGATRGYTEERRFVRRDGASVTYLLRACAIPAGDGLTSFAMGIVEDVTEKRAMQAQLVTSDRLAHVGVLAAGIAHEINNPLAYVLANLNYVLDELAGRSRGAADRGELIEALREARAGGEKVQQIVRDLRAYARPDRDAAESSDVAAVVGSVLTLSQSEVKRRATLAVQVEDVPRVAGSAQRVGQVLLNLVMNAAQAIPPGDSQRHQIVIGARAAGERVEISVSDDGEGISPEVLPRIFDPFFSTKAPGEGTGLGLWICDSIVRSLGGKIAVESAKGAGTRFTVTLPAAPLAAGPEVCAASAFAHEGRAKVLVVDDDPLVAAALARTLGRFHEVVCFTSAGAALASLETDARFDAVLCDVVMPGVSGIAFAARIEETHPALARVFAFITGGPLSPDLERAVKECPYPVLDKPFDRDALLRFVSACAGRRAAGP